MESLSRVRTVAVFTWGVSRVPQLARLAGAERVVFWPRDADARSIDAVLIWGQKPSAKRGMSYASRHRLPLWRAEDGFLRSVGLGVEGAPPLSIVLDDLGIYYDARKPSRLETWLAATGGGDPLEDAVLLQRARAAMHRIREDDLSKYNDAPPRMLDLGPKKRPRVLVIDQTAGDQSVRCGLASAQSFERMLAAARTEHPDAEIVVKMHPDVLAGKKRGYLEHTRGARVVAEPTPPFSLLAQIDHVYAVTSQLGFEALMAGLPVTLFGAPWYAGWGLTDDRVAVRRRGRKRSLDSLFAAAYLRYARYLDPRSSTEGELEDVIDHLSLQRAMFAKNRGKLFCFGFRLWKQSYMRAFLKCPGNEVKFEASAKGAAADGLDGSSRAWVWGQKESAEVRALVERVGAPLCRVEDGFLRSVGLGSDLAMPASLVFDESGIYYDPSRPSDLETLLQTSVFSAAEVARARALRERIVGAGLSKYNVGGDQRVEVPSDRQVVLVPGQVEDDASIQLGCRDVRTNLGLLEAARAARPDAFIVYKPHPDVLSKNRRGEVAAERAGRVADHIETGASLASCLQIADEVHTMTSLVGFEALLRGKRVVVYGQPFYAGWGLTEDRHPPARRSRQLALDELVAGAMLRYPRYVDREGGFFTTPEATIDQLLRERDGAGDRRVQMTWLGRQLRKLAYVYRGVVHAP